MTNITLKYFNAFFLSNILACIHFNTLLCEPFRKRCCRENMGIFIKVPCD